MIEEKKQPKFPEEFTARYALDRLIGAHMCLMTSTPIWYNRAICEADAFICQAASDLRKVSVSTSGGKVIRRT